MIANERIHCYIHKYMYIYLNTTYIFYLFIFKSTLEEQSVKIFQEYFGYGEFFVSLYDQVNLGGTISVLEISMEYFPYREFF